MNETDLRERLARAGESLRVGGPPVERITQRGRRRSAQRVLAGSLVAIVLAPAILWAGLTLSRTEVSSGPGEVVHIDVGGRPIRPMVVGEGALWAIVQKDGGGRLAVVRVDEETNTATDVAAAGEAGWVTVGGGSVWAVSLGCPGVPQEFCSRHQLLRIDPESLEVETSIELPGTSGGLTFGEGAVWVAVHAPGGAIRSTMLRIDPETEARSEFEDCCGVDPVAVAGSVWTIGNTGQILRLDSTSGQVEQVKLSGPGRPRFYGGGHILAGAGESVWVVAGGGGLSPVVRIDARTREVAEVFDRAGFGYPAVDGDELWMARCNVDCIELVRLRANGERPEPRVVRPGPDADYIRHGISLGPTYTVATSARDIWIGNEEGFEVIRVPRERLEEQPASHDPVEHYDMGGRPVRPVAVGYGAAWFTVQEGNAGKLGLTRIDSATGEVTRVDAAGRAEYVAVGAGSVWAAACSVRTISGCSEPRVVRVDPRTLETSATIPLPGNALSLAFGGGSAWVAVHTDKPSILRIDPATNQVVATIADQFCCHDIAFGEGALWGIAQGRPHDGELARIDTTTNMITYPAESLRERFGYGAGTVTAGEGAVWVEASGTLVRIDPVTGRITDVLENAARSLFVAAEGAVWSARLTADQACVLLVRVDPDQVEPEVVRVIPLMGEWHPMDFVSLGPSMATGAGEGAVWITIDATWEAIRVDLDGLGEVAITDPAC